MEESIIVHWKVKRFEHSQEQESAFVLNVLRGREVYLVDALLHFIQSATLPSLCYEFYGLVGETPLLLESPSSILPITNDSQLELVLIPSRHPPIVLLEQYDLFTRYSRNLLHGSNASKETSRHLTHTDDSLSSISSHSNIRSQNRGIKKDTHTVGHSFRDYESGITQKQTLNNVASNVGEAAKSLWGFASSAIEKVASNMHAASGSSGTEKVGDYTVFIEDKIAEGGFGVVYRASDSNDTGCKYALKQMFCQSQEQWEEAKNEVTALRRFCDSDHIIQLLGYSSRTSKEHTNGTKTVMMLFPLYIRGTVWNIVEGVGGSEREGPEWPISEQYALELCLGVARGLQEMHEQGFAHRDVKPQNILINANGAPVIMDMGSVREARINVLNRSDALNVEEAAARLTSAAYRAPELTSTPNPISIDERVDIWGLGCSLFCFAFGRSPFETLREGVLRLAILNGTYTVPSGNRHRNIEFSSAFAKLIDNMLAPSGTHRPFAAQVISVCEDLLNRSTTGMGFIHGHDFNIFRSEECLAVQKDLNTDSTDKSNVDSHNLKESSGSVNLLF